MNMPLLHFTDKARDMIRGFFDEEPDAQYYAVRVAVERDSPAPPRCVVSMVESEYVTGEDHVFDGCGFRVAIDPRSAELLDGGRVDWMDIAGHTGFDVQSPRLALLGFAPLDGPLAIRVKMVIERDLNPYAATHGGQIRLVDVRRNTAYVQLSGRCQGCGMALVTLRDGLERLLRQAVPEIERIVDVTDHRAGQNPYC
jgi:Fe/S biogenesis protein NfuA